MIERKTIKQDNLTSLGIASALNQAFEDGYKLRGVEVFSMGTRPYVDYYLEREVDAKGLPLLRVKYVQNT